MKMLNGRDEFERPDAEQLRRQDREQRNTIRCQRGPDDLEILQEKYQFREPGSGGEPEVAEQGWATAKSARVARPIAGGALGITEIPIDRNKDPVDSRWLDYEVSGIAARNDPARGQQLDQVIAQDQMPLRLPEDYGGDVTKPFTLHPMASTDDNTGDHDAYGKVRGEDAAGERREGFLRRRNVLDRE